MKAKYQRGEVVSVDLGMPPSIKGHEQAKERPCMVVRSFDALQLAIIIPFTSKKHSDYFFNIVEIQKGIGGPTADSYLMCHHIRSISYDRIRKKFGQLSPREIQKVLAVLSDTLIN